MNGFLIPAAIAVAILLGVSAILAAAELAIRARRRRESQ